MSDVIKSDILDDELVLPPFTDKTIVQEKLTKEYIVNIDQGIEEATVFRYVFDVLRKATENDTVRVILNTPGGYVTTGVQILNYLLSTKATTVAEVYNACSAGAIIAMHCDKIEIAPYGFMMIHSMSGGFSGKASDAKTYTDFIEKWNEDIMKGTFKGFLSDTEIKTVLGGSEIWLDKKSVDSRLKDWIPIRQRIKKPTIKK